MAQFDPHSNFGQSLIATAPSPATSGTTLTLTTGDVAALGLPTTGSFDAGIWPAGALPLVSNCEIVRCTWTSGDSYNIVRNQEGSTNRAVLIGDQFELGDFKKLFTDLETAINDTSFAWFTG